MFRCERKRIRLDDIDYEQFLGFLDFEHFLGLKGSKTFSSEGSRSQLMVRKAIAFVLNNMAPTEPFPLYRKFASKLTTTDTIFTFNYDTLLEKALEAENIPYRLFPYADLSREEVVVVKLHGSIDWFDKSHYNILAENAKCHNEPYVPTDPVFGPDSLVDPIPIIDEPRANNDPLLQIYRVKEIAPLARTGFWEGCPYILAPSQNKVFYSQPLKEFWYGLQRYGGHNLSLGVIGYSLPSNDAYARQVLYNIFGNYVDVDPGFEIEGCKKTKIRILDYQPSIMEQRAFKKRYRFADRRKTEWCFDGFNEETVDWFFR